MGTYQLGQPPAPSLRHVVPLHRCVSAVGAGKVTCMAIPHELMVERMPMHIVLRVTQRSA